MTIVARILLCGILCFSVESKENAVLNRNIVKENAQNPIVLKMKKVASFDDFSKQKITEEASVSPLDSNFRGQKVLKAMRAIMEDESVSLNQFNEFGKRAGCSLKKWKKYGDSLSIQRVLKQREKEVLDSLKRVRFRQLA